MFKLSRNFLVFCVVQTITEIHTCKTKQNLKLIVILSNSCAPMFLRITFTASGRYTEWNATMRNDYSEYRHSLI